jgi:hypothetical protein
MAGSRRPPYHPEAFATHIPVLVGVATLLEVRCVLELGVGRYSTPLFLNRDVFPSLTQLDSLEDDPGWAEDAAVLAHADPRLHLRVVDPGMVEAANQAVSEPPGLNSGDSC